MSDTTPARVAVNATRPDAIDLRGLTVIGVMHAHDGPAALLRSGRARIARVQTGTTVFGVTVAGIGDDQVMLTDRFGRAKAVIIAGS